VNYGNNPIPTKGHIPVIPHPNPNKAAPINIKLSTFFVGGYAKSKSKNGLLNYLKPK
jgi:hypothetical protein